MGSHVGVDWASGAWVVVEATADSTCVSAEPSLLNVWQEYGDQASEILVDVPLHLVSEGVRECDRAAKDVLGSRSSTVFWTPTHDAIEARDYETAADRNTGGLGSQSWGPIPRIREARALLEAIPEGHETIYESHPEVCFKALHGDDLPSKTDEAGFEARKSCLINHGGESFQPVLDFVAERRANSQWHHRIQSGRVDDVLDAAVLALTARTTAEDYPTLPADADPSCNPSIVYPGT
jgi:predicted RNase H-like nuclease